MSRDDLDECETPDAESKSDLDAVPVFVKTEGVRKPSKDKAVTIAIWAYVEIIYHMLLLAQFMTVACRGISLYIVLLVVGFPVVMTWRRIRRDEKYIRAVWTWLWFDDEGAFACTAHEKAE
jgi:hypothetical protein